MTTCNSTIKLSQLPIGSIFSFRKCGYGYKLLDVIHCSHTDTTYYKYCYYHTYSNGISQLVHKTRTNDANVYPVFIKNAI